MTEAISRTRSSRLRTGHANGWGVVLIGLGKLTSGLLFAAAGVGIFHYLHRDLREAAEHFVTLIRLDPENRLVHAIVARVSGIDHKQLRELGLGTFFYAVLHLVEGTGLILRRHWAEYLTIVSTGSLIPVEGMIAVRRMNVPKLLILLLNILIVLYLIMKLVQQRRAESGGRGSLPATAAPSGPGQVSGRLS